MANILLQLGAALIRTIRGTESSSVSIKSPISEQQLVALSERLSNGTYSANVGTADKMLIVQWHLLGTFLNVISYLMVGFFFLFAVSAALGIAQLDTNLALTGVAGMFVVVLIGRLLVFSWRPSPGDAWDRIAPD
ncbi:MAG: hypothetical protein AAFY82_02305 [Pseudomonadota bacterium]